MRLHYEIVVLRQRQNLMELAINQVHVIRKIEEKINGDYGSDHGLVDDDSFACIWSADGRTLQRRPGDF